MNYEEAGWVRRCLWGVQDNAVEIITITLVVLLFYYILL